MKKVFYVFLSLLMCALASCQKDDVVPEPQPEPKPIVIRYAEYETNDDYVDLGVGDFMIATKNLGAKRPEDTGDFFAWGETEPKEVYSWDTYKLRVSTLYYKDDELLLPQDDAATVILGQGWRLPTVDEVDLLADNYTTDDNCCRMRPTVSNGVYGYQLIGSNGNSVFFPASGNYGGTTLYDRGSYGGYWSSTYGSETNARSLSFGSSEVNPTGNDGRRVGFTVRAVQ
jgi:uncharacterized protein (TIGR02145 family)